MGGVPFFKKNERYVKKKGRQRNRTQMPRLTYYAGDTVNEKGATILANRNKTTSHVFMLLCALWHTQDGEEEETHILAFHVTELVKELRMAHFCEGFNELFIEMETMASQVILPHTSFSSCSVTSAQRFTLPLLSLHIVLDYEAYIKKKLQKTYPSLTREALTRVISIHLDALTLFTLLHFVPRCKIRFYCRDASLDAFRNHFAMLMNVMDVAYLEVSANTIRLYETGSTLTWCVYGQRLPSGSSSKLQTRQLCGKKYQQKSILPHRLTLTPFVRVMV